MGVFFLLKIVHVRGALYIFFVAELLDIIAKVPLSDGDPVVEKFPLRALMVADDLAVCEFSQRGAAATTLILNRTLRGSR